METNENKHKNLVSRIKSRKREQFLKEPYGTSMNGYTKNTPLRFDEGALNKRMRTLRDRKAIESQRKRKTQKIKKKPLPVEEMEEFLGMTQVDPLQKREWNLEESEYLRFQSARHSANNVKEKGTIDKSSNVKQSKPLSIHQLKIHNNSDYYNQFVKNIPEVAPRFQGRYASVKPRPKPVKSGPRSQERYENIKPRPEPVRRGSRKTKHKNGNKK